MTGTVRRLQLSRRLTRVVDVLRSRVGERPPTPGPDFLSAAAGRRHNIVLRRLRPAERRIVTVMLDRAGHHPAIPERLDRAWVYELDDGGMGSLRFVRPDGAPGLGRYIGPADFVDADGVTVFVWLNFDKRGDLFELDVWKTDYQPLVTFPKSFR
ncbi:MAG: hypothetical protein JWQ43_1660 [Glaciihabitans sp.]|nr:hypothetical protein [Glaciihabitans sp.]